MILFPNAKINIGLDILRRRPDGYHDLSTVMAPTGWTDILEIVPSKDEIDRLSVTGRKIACPPESNIVMKAVKALRTEFNFPAVDIHLHKIIPDGAGLGGGSADAAFTIRGINQLFSLGLTDEQMAATAASLGADCAFFIYNRPMMCEGIGNVLSSTALPIPDNLQLAIINPEISVSTAQAYSKVIPGVPATPLNEIIENTPFELWQGRVKNDFETSVFLQFPEIEFIKTTLLDLGAIYASMSGSGSSVYGFFDTPDALPELQTAFPTSTIFYAPFNPQQTLCDGASH